MEALKLNHGIRHSIKRQDVYAGVLKLYQTSQEEILEEYPFRIRFEGELAVDVGGVSRDMFSAFFEEAYRKLFEGALLVTPAVHPGMDYSLLPLLGCIISHAYLVSGILPVRIVFPCLATILVSQCELPEEVLLTTMINSLSIHDTSVFRQALVEVRDKLPSFSAEILSGLIHALSFYGCREVPRPETLKRILLQISNFEFRVKPASALASIHSGIPTKHLPFWEKMAVGELYSIYSTLSVSRGKVLKMFEGCTTANPTEERILSYLKLYVGSMHLDELRAFLRFVTGSCVCTARRIIVAFNRLDGLARRPIAHTCNYTLELPTTYSTFSDFSSEFQLVLKDDDSAWVMDAL